MNNITNTVLLIINLIQNLLNAYNQEEPMSAEEIAIRAQQVENNRYQGEIYRD